MKILIAEDDIISRKLLGRTLESWGYEVTSVENGIEAFEIVKNTEMNFVIADWEMPNMNGIELCEKVRSSKMSDYVYIILLTGKDRREDIVEGLTAGADDYVTKPFHRDELKVRVKTGERVLKLQNELKAKNEKLEQFNKKLEELARMDVLMKIGNRRHFYEIMDKVHHASIRYKRKYGLIMCDIDNFKLYNDTYGHLAGDYILKIVAQTIKKSLRRSDDIFRYGGEEIVIVLPEQNEESTLIVAEKIRKDIEDLELEHIKNNAGIVTISCGATVLPRDIKDENWEKVLDYADKALYEAKLNGRNKVCFK